MRRVGRTAAAAALALALLAGLASPRADALGPTAFVDPALAAALEGASPITPLEVVAVLDSVPLAGDLAVLRATGATIGGFTRLPMAAALATPGQISLLQALPLVRSLWLNVAVEETLDESTKQIQADQAWAEARQAPEPTGFTGRGIGVATIDSGIDGLHPGVHYPEVTTQNVKLIGFKDAVWGVPVENLPVTDVTSGHGSHVAGIIAGRGTASGSYRGVAPDAHLIGLGASDGLEMLTILQAYDWIIEHRVQYGIRVINNSWAHSDPQVPYLAGNPLDAASKAAVDAGLVVVFAAGNQGQASGDVFNAYARNDWVVSVGSVNKKGALSSFSSRGNDTHHSTVMAPGDWIASVRATAGPISQANATPFDLTDPAAPRVLPVDQWPYYTVKSGTSMATPHVSGVVALMLEANPALTPAQVRTILSTTATAVPGCPTFDCGAGVVNALSAVRAARQAGANQAPIATLTASPSSGAAPLAVTLDASASTDADGAVVAYRWDWQGDGTIDTESTAAVVSHTFLAGVHRPRVTVVDDRGVASASVGVEVRASNPPDAEASGPTKGKSGQSLAFSAAASTDPDGSIVRYEWNFADGSPIVVTTTPTVSHTYIAERPTIYGWSVTVVDDTGARDAVGASIKITP